MIYGNWFNNLTNTWQWPALYKKKNNTRLPSSSFLSYFWFHNTHPGVHVLNLSLSSNEYKLFLKIKWHSWRHWIYPVSNTPKCMRWPRLESGWAGQYCWPAWDHGMSLWAWGERSADENKLDTSVLGWEVSWKSGCATHQMRCLGRCSLQVCSKRSLYLPSGECLLLFIVWICFAFPLRFPTSSQAPAKKPLS